MILEDELTQEFLSREIAFGSEGLNGTEEFIHAVEFVSVFLPLLEFFFLGLLAFFAFGVLLMGAAFVYLKFWRNSNWNAKEEK